MITATALTGAGGAVALAGTGPERAGRWEPALSGGPLPEVYQATWTPAAKRRKVKVRNDKTRNKAIALSFVVQRAWTMRQFRCLDSLWTRESNWNHRAVNDSSGAYGIPQALPAGKMAGAGYDWRSNPVTQIRWGLDYIKVRYGSPCGAWGHFRAHNWY
ncbi:hypothetical protein HNP84_000848 [Thermocatellispora tengchongensis]|uniref:Lytic transglycosylase domain-containing protein n=1 Tax=Thermocatellispora tengchongensis TaxID=1073253 RepID=A0A840NV85_9ACTN|nr:lytic transglycosylase domain-containing protein [Thermocatellispora tengchongensis]MBB5131142.1 hypothetical protein [Thermocatellispora tengchongensis]